VVGADFRAVATRDVDVVITDAAVGAAAAGDGVRGLHAFDGHGSILSVCPSARCLFGFTSWMMSMVFPLR